VGYDWSHDDHEIPIDQFAKESSRIGGRWRFDPKELRKWIASDRIVTATKTRNLKGLL
jgi:hypothetical protein